VSPGDVVPNIVVPTDDDCEITDEELRLMRRARGLQFGLSDEDWDAMRAERDAAITRQES
jgi:hypothetical protein